MPEKFEIAALFLRLSLPSKLIHHENGAFRESSSKKKNLKMPFFAHQCRRKTFWKWSLCFSCSSFPQPQSQDDLMHQKWRFRILLFWRAFSKCSVVWTGPKWHSFQMTLKKVLMSWFHWTGIRSRKNWQLYSWSIVTQQNDTSQHTLLTTGTQNK